MPYRRLAQERFFHSAGAAAAGIKPSTVAEFDAASKGQALPMKVNTPRTRLAQSLANRMSKRLSPRP